MIYLSLCSLIWAFSYGLIKQNLIGLQADFVALARMAIPFFLFLPLLRLKNLSVKQALSFVCIGIVQYGLMYMFVIRAYHHLAAYQVVLFTAFTPLYVTVIHDIFTKSFRSFYLLTSLLALCSIAILYYQDLTVSFSLKGFFLVQLSDLCFAFGQVAYKHVKKTAFTVADKNLYALLFFGGFIITLLSTTVFQGWNSLYVLTLKQASLLFYLGSVASGLCFFWWNKASLMTLAGTLAIFNNMKIPLGIFVSIVLFKEKANIPTLILSSVLIAFAIFLSERHTKKQKLANVKA